MNQILLSKMQAMSEEELFSSLYKDSLTGAYNRRAFDQAEYSTVAIIDLDSLKYLNDTHGHRTGDDYLKILVSNLCMVFNNEDVYRLAGDEFAVTSELYEGQIASILELVRERFPAFSYGIGITLAEADDALNEQKHRREQCGQRASRGECPPWLRKIFA